MCISLTWLPKLPLPEPGSAGGLSLLRGSFSLPTVTKCSLRGSRLIAMVFSAFLPVLYIIKCLEAPVVLNLCYINKIE